jgi:ParB-like chromosome segregation protein Spo0J
MDAILIDAIHTIALDRLHANEDYQPREDGLDAEHLERLRASDPALWPPLLVSANEAGGYDVIDGFHRLHIAREQGLTTLRCQVVDDAGYPEAVAANLAHGLPLSIADRKAYVCWLHEQEPELSYSELARRSGLSDKTVKRVLLPEFSYVRSETPSEPNSDEDAFRVPAVPPDPVVKLVRLARLAVTDQAGVSKLAQFFSKKTDAQQRAEYVRRVVASYDAKERPAVAAALTTLGTALIEGARSHQQP